MFGYEDEYARFLTGVSRIVIPFGVSAGLILLTMGLPVNPTEACVHFVLWIVMGTVLSLPYEQFLKTQKERKQMEKDNV